MQHRRRSEHHSTTPLVPYPGEYGASYVPPPHASYSASPVLHTPPISGYSPATTHGLPQWHHQFGGEEPRMGGAAPHSHSHGTHEGFDTSRTFSRSAAHRAAPATYFSQGPPPYPALCDDATARNDRGIDNHSSSSVHTPLQERPSSPSWSLHYPNAHAGARSGHHEYAQQYNVPPAPYDQSQHNQYNGSTHAHHYDASEPRHQGDVVFPSGHDSYHSRSSAAPPHSQSLSTSLSEVHHRFQSSTVQAQQLAASTSFLHAVELEGHSHPPHNLHHPTSDNYQHFTAAPTHTLPPPRTVPEAHTSALAHDAGRSATGQARGAKQLIVNYLAPEVTSAVLHRVFSQYGPLDGARVIYDRDTGNTKGFGFVYFRFAESAAAALAALDGSELHGKWLKIAYSSNPLHLATVRRRAMHQNAPPNSQHSSGELQAGPQQSHLRDHHRDDRTGQ